MDILENNQVRGTTRVIGIIGDPIEHAPSPVMQNAAFRKLGLDYIFVAFRVKSEGLEQAIRGMRALNIRGLNVTIPHKVAVMPFLDEMDPMAQKIGAVNTIVNTGGVLKGYNTDAPGALKALQAAGINPKKKNVVILGAGGATRAIAFVLAEEGANLTLLNRHVEKARGLADRVASSLRKKVGVQEFNPENLKAVLAKAELLINTTSVGMAPQAEESLVPEGLLRSDLAVFDIINNPLKTRLMKEAEKVGARVVSGVEMVVWQGAVGFELWTGHKAPAEVMQRAILKVLKPAKTNIALVGFMGAGKTAAGRRLAEKLGKEFVETDALVEMKAGKSIPRIFEEEGEIAFREREIEVVKEVAGRHNQVIACGGGVALNRINIDRLKKEAVVVWLTAPPEVIMERTRDVRDSRPLLRDAFSLEDIQLLMKFRRPFYLGAADITVENSGNDLDKATMHIIQKLEEHENQHP